MGEGLWSGREERKWHCKVTSYSDEYMH